MRRRHVVRVARFAVAEQLQGASAPLVARSSRAKPAASPRLMPLRSASNGRHGSGETSCSALKPNRTLPHSVSTPPTTAASARPRRSSRSAVANTLALDEHAVETVTHGPSRSSASLHEAGERMRRVHAAGCGCRRESRRRRRARGRRPRSRRCSRSRCRARARRAPRRGARAPRATASMKPSPAGRARRAGCCGTPRRRAPSGSGAASRPATRPIQVASGRRPEVVRRQGAAAGAQGGEQGGLADAGGGGRRVGGDAQRGDGGGTADGRAGSGPAIIAGALAAADAAAQPGAAVDDVGDDDPAEDDDHRRDREQRRPRPEAVQQRAEDERAEPLADEEAAGEQRHRRAARRRRELGRLGLHRVVQHVEADAGDEHRQRRQPPGRHEGERGVAGGGQRRADQAHAAHAEAGAASARTLAA